jgi:hypothetical protein
MKHNWRHSYILQLAAILIAFAALAVVSSEKVSSGSAGQPKAAGERFETYAFDNCRFFCARTADGVDVGNKGWFNITVKGHRDYIAGIDAARSALV